MYFPKNFKADLPLVETKAPIEKPVTWADRHPVWNTLLQIAVVAIVMELLS